MRSNQPHFDLLLVCWQCGLRIVELRCPTEHRFGMLQDSLPALEHLLLQFAVQLVVAARDRLKN